MTSTKIIGLTSHNVAAIEAAIPADLGVDTTATTATFSMDAYSALALVEATIRRLPKGTTRQSLHAVRRKLQRATGAGLPGRDYVTRGEDGQPFDPYSGKELEL